ncbi:MAG: phytanoyl-CoA dioxygenase family protein [Alphaproteobacteria bacterium]
MSAELADPYDWKARITPGIQQQYSEDGCVFLKQLLHPEWLAQIEMGLTRVMGNAAQAKYKFYEDRDDEFTETVRNMEVAPEIRRLVYESPIADMIGQLIGSQNIWYYSDEFFIKDGAGCGRTPWHQDMPYFPMEGTQVASIWVSLDPLKKEECLEMIPGTHLTTRYDGFDPGAVSEDPTAPYYGEDLPPLPDIQAERDKWTIVSWDIEPGDVIFLHPAVLHGGGPTGENGKRRAITIRLYGDDIVYGARPASRPTSPYTPGVSRMLKPGDPLRSPWYPRLRPLPEHRRAS